MLYSTPAPYSVSPITPTTNVPSVPAAQARRAMAGMPRIVSHTATAPPTRPSNNLYEAPQMFVDGTLQSDAEAPAYATHAHDFEIDNSWHSTSPPSLTAHAHHKHTSHNDSTSMLNMGCTPPPLSNGAYSNAHSMSNNTTATCVAGCTPSSHRKTPLAPGEISTSYYSRRIYSPISSPLQATRYAPAELYGISESRENACSTLYANGLVHNSWTSLNDGVHEVSPIRVVPPRPASTNTLVPNGTVSSSSSSAPSLLLHVNHNHTGGGLLHSVHVSPTQTMPTTNEPIAQAQGVEEEEEMECANGVHCATMTSSPQWVKKVIHCFDIHLMQDPATTTTHITRTRQPQPCQVRQDMHDARAESVIADEYISTREVSVQQEGKPALQSPGPIIVVEEDNNKAVSETAATVKATSADTNGTSMPPTPAVVVSGVRTAPHNTRHVESRSVLHRGARRRRSGRLPADSPSPTSAQDDKVSETIITEGGNDVSEECVTKMVNTNVTNFSNNEEESVVVVAEAAVTQVRPITTNQTTFVAAVPQQTCEQLCGEKAEMICSEPSPAHTLPVDYITPPRRTPREAHVVSPEGNSGGEPSPECNGSASRLSMSEGRISSHSPRRSLSVQSGELQHLLASATRRSQEREAHCAPHWLFDEEPQSPPPCALAGFAEASTAHVKTRPVTRT